MNLALWILQGLYAAFFLYVGSNHAFQQWEKLTKQIPALGDLSTPFVRFLGICELLGVIGLIVPGVIMQTHLDTGLPAAIAHVLPWVTVAAAFGFAFEMLCATLFHMRRREFTQLGIPATLCLLALFIAVGRLVLAPL